MIIQLKQIAEHHLLNGLFCQEIGLWKGKTGMSIFFFLLSRHTGNHWYEEFAGELLDDVCSHLSLHCPVTFADGLCGIGWAIEFLKKEGFIEGDTDEILAGVDRQVMERDVRRITDASLETGLAGVVAYVRSRLDSQRNSNSIPFDTSYLESLNHACLSVDILWKSNNYSLDVIKNQIQDRFKTFTSNEQVCWQFGIRLLYKASTLGYYDNHYSSEQYKHEEELRHSAKRYIFIFQEESIAVQYGIGTYTHTLLECFDSSKWNINVITLHKGKDDVSFRLENGIGYYDFPIPKEQFLSGNPYYEELYFRSVFYYLASRLNKESKVYCHFNFTRHQVLAECFKKYMSAFVTYTFHYADWKFDLLGNQAELERIISQPVTSKELRIKQKFEKEKLFLQNTCNRVIAIAEHSYNMLHELYELPYSQLSYIPHGVKDYFHEIEKDSKAVLRKKYGFKEADKILLFVGRMDVMKGTMYLMEAFTELCKEEYSLQLIIVGTGDFSQCLKITNPYWSNIMFTGYLPMEQIMELYAMADYGVIPSIHEEFGFVAAEMMLNMLPIVVHDSSGLHEVTNAGKYGVPFIYEKNKEVQSLKKAIIKITENILTKEKLKKGREWIINNYSTTLFVERIKKLYSHK